MGLCISCNKKKQLVPINKAPILENDPQKKFNRPLMIENLDNIPLRK